MHCAHMYREGWLPAFSPKDVVTRPHIEGCTVSYNQKHKQYHTILPKLQTQFYDTGVAVQPL